MMQHIIIELFQGVKVVPKAFDKPLDIQSMLCFFIFWVDNQLVKLCTQFGFVRNQV